ncbi:hypothetical protein [Isoptericola croceus]|uniref:hypothetical protein n=1 Tax=Isoptericola croceus TaxID=3031406 RepID=UPI0023F74559|nr:hypothetical protein [Isoptericola croceus]
MARAKRSRKAAQTAWDGAEEVPRAGMPDAVELTRRRRRARWVVLAWPALIPMLIGAGIVSQAGAEDDQVAAVQGSTPGRAAAEQAVRQWLMSEPSPLPGGQVQSWDGAEFVVRPPDPAAGPDDPHHDLELHTMTLVTDDGRLYTAGVQVAISDALGAVVVGTPSLEPVAPAADVSAWSELEGWPDTTPLAVPESVTDAVASWASAYASGDPVALRQNVSDPSEEHSYVPLTAVAQATAETRFGAALTPDFDELAAPEMVVRAELSLVWAGQEELIDEMSLDSTPMTFDVLVTGADTASPKVVAWGAPGTGPQLTPYANAVTGRMVEVEDTLATPEPTPSSSEGVESGEEATETTEQEESS